VHPYDAGHQLYAEAVARAMEQLRGVGEPGRHALGEPFRKGDFEFARPMPLDRAKLSPGWRKLHLVNDPAVRQMWERIEFGDKLLALWVAEKPGESISFRFRGMSVMLYDVMGPGEGQVVVTIDDQQPRIVPRFDSWCEF